VTTPKPRERVGQYMKKGDLIVEVHEFTTVRVGDRRSQSGRSAT